MDPLDQFAADTIGAAPPPSENAIEAESQRIEETQHATAGLVDREGYPFDSDLHVTGPDGAPALTKTGKLKRKPGRRPSANQARSTPQSTLNIPGPGGSPGEPGEPGPESAMVAAYTVDMIQSVGLMLGGDEWVFQKDDKTGVDERAHGVLAFTRFYDSHGIVDLPPGLALAVWGLSYAAPRLVAGPKTKTRLARAYLWVRSKVLRKRPSAHSDHRNDGIGQDNVGDPFEREVPGGGMESRSARPAT